MGLRFSYLGGCILWSYRLGVGLVHGRRDGCRIVIYAFCIVLAVTSVIKRQAPIENHSHIALHA